MEPEGLLPRSQVPAICLYPEPAYSIPYPQHHPSWRPTWWGGGGGAPAPPPHAQHPQSPARGGGGLTAPPPPPRH
jgi:hypothetical protein